MYTNIPDFTIIVLYQVNKKQIKFQYENHTKSTYLLYILIF